MSYTTQERSVPYITLRPYDETLVFSETDGVYADLLFIEKKLKALNADLERLTCLLLRELDMVRTSEGEK